MCGVFDWPWNRPSTMASGNLNASSPNLHKVWSGYDGRQARTECPGVDERRQRQLGMTVEMADGKHGGFAPTCIPPPLARAPQT